MAAGKLLIFSAPSGAGKSTLVKALMQHLPSLQFSVSATNRPPREGEVNGVHYWFLSTEAFLQKVKEGAFLEWEEVYPGRYYGTLKEKVSALLEAGTHLVFDIDVVGGLNLKRMYEARAQAIFVMPPSIEALEQRLRSRGTDSEDDIKNRVKKAQLEMESAGQFDVIILNDHLDSAIEKTLATVQQYLDA
jgi:guanylate kinase